MWLAEYCSGEMIRWVATVLDSVGANYFYHCRKLCWAMVFSRKQNRLKLSQAIEGENIKRFDRNSSDAFEAEHHWGSRSWAELRILRSLKTSSGGFQPGSRVADLSPPLKDVHLSLTGHLFDFSWLAARKPTHAIGSRFLHILQRAQVSF